MAYPVIENFQYAFDTNNQSASMEFALQNSSGNNRALICFSFWANNKPIPTVTFDPGGSDEASFTQSIGVNLVGSDARAFILTESELPTSSGTYTIEQEFSSTANHVFGVYELSGADQAAIPSASDTWNTTTANVDPTLTFTVPDNLSLVLGLMLYKGDGLWGYFASYDDGFVKTDEKGAGNYNKGGWGYEQVASSGSNTIGASASCDTTQALALGMSFRGPTATTALPMAMNTYRQMR
jgi:hypothetical protein